MNYVIHIYTINYKGFVQLIENGNNFILTPSIEYATKFKRPGKLRDVLMDVMRVAKHRVLRSRLDWGSIEDHIHILRMTKY